MELRIDQLAARTGLTSRNIRAYQQRGLLPPPRLRGRTGFYGEDHIRRLTLVRDLQERGFTLEGIRHLLDAWSRGGDIRDLLGLHEVLQSPWSEDAAVSLSAEELFERFPEAANEPALVQQAVAEGLLELDADGRYRAPSILIEAGAQLSRAGIPLEEIFALVRDVRRNAAEIAQRFVGIVADRLIEPITSGTASPEAIRSTTETVLHLRGLAVEVVRPFLANELASATDAVLETLGGRLDRDEAEGA